jgi:hypothetical protein
MLAMNSGGSVTAGAEGLQGVGTNERACPVTACRFGVPFENIGHFSKTGEFLRETAARGRHAFSNRAFLFAYRVIGFLRESAFAQGCSMLAVQSVTAGFVQGFGPEASLRRVARA